LILRAGFRVGLAVRRGSGGAVGEQHHGHEQREWQKDGKGGSVEYKHRLRLQ
jgi:hypothetical protein